MGNTPFFTAAAETTITATVLKMEKDGVWSSGLWEQIQKM
jgi:hypothetical protein